MDIQHINATDAERAYVSFSNYDGQTISAFRPVFLFTAIGNIASVNGNNAGQAPRALGTGGIPGSFSGLTHKDVGQGAGRVGTAIAYGYLQSCVIYAGGANGTIRPGDVMGPNATLLGVNSLGAYKHPMGPVVLLGATIGDALCSAGGTADHVFVRAL